MSPLARFWLLTVVLAIGTWLMRSLPIMLHGHVPNPKWAERFLRYVPVAAMTAIAVPGLVFLKSAEHYAISPARIVAAVLASLAALKTRNVALTLAVGMIALWVAQAGLAALG